MLLTELGLYQLFGLWARESGGVMLRGRIMTGESRKLSKGGNKKGPDCQANKNTKPTGNFKYTQIASSRGGFFAYAQLS